MSRNRVYSLKVTTCEQVAAGELRFLTFCREVPAQSKSQAVAILDDIVTRRGHSLYEVQFLCDF